MNKKILSVLLCAVMLMSSLSVFTSALSLDVEIDLGGLFDPEPEEPEVPDKPEEPDTPDNPDEPETPETPDVPEDKDDKEDTSKPSVKPSNPSKPSTPSDKDDKEENGDDESGVYGDIDLAAVTSSLYNGIPEDKMPMVMTMPLDEEMFESFTFVSYEGELEAAASEPMIGSIAHSLVLVKCPTAEKAVRVAAEMEANCDPRKWVCVEADTVKTAVNGNIAMLLMTKSELGIADKIVSNFNALNEDNIYDIKSEEVEEEEPAEWVNPFTDVKESDWYYETVKYASENGIMNGTSETEFAPGTTLTRAMLVTILYRVEGSPEVEADSKFTDVKADSWYGAPVIWAAENGIVNGVSETEFAPNTAITREQIAAIMYRYAVSKNHDTAIEGKDVSEYDDASSISGWAKDAVQWAVNAKLINGKTATTVNPLDKATRAEAATIIMRFLESIA